METGFVNTPLRSLVARLPIALAAVESRLVNVMLQLLRAADPASSITFATGLVVGLLIPSEDWPTIITVTIAGVILQSIVKRIDRKRGEPSKSREPEVSLSRKASASPIEPRWLRAHPRRLAVYGKADPLSCTFSTSSPHLLEGGQKC